MMECFDDRLVAKLVSGTLPGSERDLCAAHIDDCDACRDLIAEAAIASTEIVAGYRVDREIARGAMGRIVSAHDVRLGREVALKQLIETTPTLRRRFEREVTITAALQHPGIVPVYQAGTLANGEPFYAMRRVRGRALDVVIAEATTLAPRLALLPRVLAAIEAVAYAHSEDVIHRDVKPANILVGDFGEVVVVDWGLAKRTGDTDEVSDRIADDVALTSDGAVLGTPAYMPPEQASGRDVDARADVYALGAVLYHLLSGRPPHAGGTLSATLDAVREGRHEPLASQADVPADLAAIVDRAMAIDPAARYANAGELADDLRGFLAGKLVAAHAYTRWQLAKRWLGKYRAWVGAATLVVVGFTVIGGISFSRVRTERDTARVERTSAEALVHSTLKEVWPALDASGQQDAIDKLSTRLVAYYDSVLAVRPDDKLTRANRAMALDMAANAAYRTGDYEKAQTIWAGTIDALREARTVDESAVLDVGLVQYNLGNIARLRGDAATAEKQYKGAIADLEPAFKKDPGLVGSALAGSLDGIVQLKMTVLDTVAARPLAERALEVGRAAQAAGKDNPENHARAAQLAYSLANLEGLEGHPAKARELLSTAVATLEALPPEPAFATSIGFQRFTLALVELSSGDLTATSEQLAKAKEVIEAAQAGGYADPQILRLAAALDLVEAQRLLAANQPAGAAVDRAIAGFEALIEKQPEAVQYKRDLAQALATRARITKSKDDITKALAMLEPMAKSPRGQLEFAYASIIAAEVGLDVDPMLARATKIVDGLATSAKPPLAHARAYIAAVRKQGYADARAELVKGAPLSMPTLVELDRLAR